MHKFLLIAFLFISPLHAQEILLKSSKNIQTEHNTAFPIQLLHADNEQVIFTKGTMLREVKSIEILNKNLQNSKTIRLPTDAKNRIDHIIWTGTQFIALWEKKEGNDRNISYQIIHKSGRKTSKSNLAVLENCFSEELKNHRVEILKSPNNLYFGFVVKDVYAKNDAGKEAGYIEMIAIFNEKGKLVERQKNYHKNYISIDGFYFLDDLGNLIKVQSNSSRGELKISKFNVNNNQKENFAIPLNIPKTVQITSYSILYNPIHNAYNYIAKTTNSGMEGFNGEFYMEFCADSTGAIQRSGEIFSKKFIDQFKYSFGFSSGNLLLKDSTLSTQFRIRKVIYKPDGGYYVVKEFFNKYLPSWMTTDLGSEYSEKNIDILNTDYGINFSLDKLDLIVTNVDYKGDILWIKRIPKPQIGLGYLYGSFDAFCSHDNLYLLYNIEFDRKSFVKKMDQNFVPLKNVEPIIKKVDNTGNTSMIAMDERVRNKMLFYPAFSYQFNSSSPDIFTTLLDKSSSPGTYSIIQLYYNNNPKEKD